MDLPVSGALVQVTMIAARPDVSRRVITPGGMQRPGLRQLPTPTPDIRSARAAVGIATRPGEPRIPVFATVIHEAHHGIVLVVL